MSQRVLPDHRLGSLPYRLRPRPFRWLRDLRFGLPAALGPLGHVEQPAEPRGRHARRDADHFEVLEGPSRPSADFFHTPSTEPRGVSRAQAGMLHEFLTSSAERAYVQSVALQIDPRFKESVTTAWEQAVRAHLDIADGFSYDGPWPQRTPGEPADLARVMHPSVLDGASPEVLMRDLRSMVELPAGSCVRAGLLETGSSIWFAIAYFHALMDGDEFAALASTFVEGLEARDDGSLPAPARFTVTRLTSADREIVQRVVEGGS